MGSKSGYSGYVYRPFQPTDADDEDGVEDLETSDEDNNAGRLKDRPLTPTLSSINSGAKAALEKQVVDVGVRRNWNESYQAILEMTESVEKFEALRDLARDFEYAAQLYARLIVSEVCLPAEKKSIKPLETHSGSINAGGTKFICAGSILFKVRCPSFWDYLNRRGVEKISSLKKSFPARLISLSFFFFSSCVFVII